MKVKFQTYLFFIIFSLILVSVGVSQTSVEPKRTVYFGTAAAVQPLRNEVDYKKTVLQEFNILVAENAMKWGVLCPRRNGCDFTDADYLVDFAQRNGMKIRGHTLVWHRQMPAWLEKGNFTRDELIEILKNHIQTLVGRYRGKIEAWDVVNEAIDDQTGDYRNSFWFKNLGEDYIKLAFEFARQADPNAKLYYNDYSAEGMNSKSDGVYKMLQKFKKDGTPIDGIGWQMHVENGFRVATEHRQNAKRLAALGLELSITEMDVRMKIPATVEDLQKQAAAYQDVAEFCLSESYCKTFMVWGFTDKHSWIPHEFPGMGSAHIFDEKYKPKPSYKAISTLFK